MNAHAVVWCCAALLKTHIDTVRVGDPSSFCNPLHITMIHSRWVLKGHHGIPLQNYRSKRRTCQDASPACIAGQIRRINEKWTLIQTETRISLYTIPEWHYVVLEWRCVQVEPFLIPTKDVCHILEKSFIPDYPQLGISDPVAVEGARSAVRLKNWSMYIRQSQP